MFCMKCVLCINISRPEAKNIDLSLIGWSHLGPWIVKNIKWPRLMRVFDQNSEWKVWCWPLWPAPRDQPVPIKTACYSSRGHHTNHTRITGTIFYLVIIIFLFIFVFVCLFQVGITRTTRRLHFFWRETSQMFDIFISSVHLLCFFGGINQHTPNTTYIWVPTKAFAVYVLFY